MTQVLRLYQCELFVEDDFIGGEVLRAASPADAVVMIAEVAETLGYAHGDHVNPKGLSVRWVLVELADTGAGVCWQLDKLQHPSGVLEAR